MKILLSPAKRMRDDPDSLPVQGLPVFLDRARRLTACLQQMRPDSLRKLWGCSEALVQQNLERLSTADLENGLTPAIFSYDGIAFQHMAPAVFDERQFAYVQQHLRILSGLYGVLRPLDGVRPYRLEMQAKLAADGAKDLYGFWGSSLYEQVRDEDGIILNLASKEYSRCIEAWLTPDDRFITCTFAERAGDRLVTRATFAKMARGEMVRYLAENEIIDPVQMQGFDRFGFHYRPELSTPENYIFERIPTKTKEYE